MYTRGTTLGNPAACMVAKQINYDPTRAADGSLTIAVQAEANCLRPGVGPATDCWGAFRYWSYGRDIHRHARLSFVWGSGIPERFHLCRYRCDREDPRLCRQLGFF